MTNTHVWHLVEESPGRSSYIAMNIVLFARTARRMAKAKAENVQVLIPMSIAMAADERR